MTTNNSIMKNKLSVFASLLVLLIGFFACDKPEAVTNQVQPTNEQSEGAHMVAPELTHILQNERRIVMYKLTMEPGDTLPWHEHPHHTVYILEEGTLKVIYEDSTITSFYSKGLTNFGSPIGDMAINTGETTIEILMHEFYYLDTEEPNELYYDPNQGAHIVAPELTEILQDNHGIVMYELTIEPGETLPWHEHPPHTFYILEEGTLEVIFENSTTTKFYPIGRTNFGPAFGDMAINTGETTIKILMHEFYSLE